MKTFYGIVTVVFLLSCQAAVAQEIVQGMVVDSASFAALPYVTVSIKGKNKGTITDQQGNFKLVATPADTLIFSFVGYRTYEMPLADYETGMILLAEEPTMLEEVTIEDQYVNPYEGMFDDENAALRRQNRKLPFYYTRAKKQTIRIGRLRNENARVQTYVDVVIKNDENRQRLMKTYDLTEAEYYDLLAGFNASNYTVMYYLTAGELVSLLNQYFARHAGKGR